MRAPSFAIATAIFLVGLGMNSLTFGQDEDKGGFFGVSIGQVEVDVSTSDFDDGSLISRDVDDTDTVWKLFGGYRFNKNLAIEGGFADGGEIKFDGVSAGGFLWAPGPVSATVETESIYVAVVGVIPFKKWALFGKLGFHRWEADSSVTNTIIGAFSFDDDGTDPMYGIGVEWRPTERLGVRFEYEVFTEVLDEDDAATSVGFVYKMR